MNRKDNLQLSIKHILMIIIGMIKVKGMNIGKVLIKMH